MLMIGVTAYELPTRRGGGHIQISIQLKSEWCQGPNEFTWPWVVLNRNLLVDRRHVSLLKLPI